MVFFQSGLPRSQRVHLLWSSSVPENAWNVHLNLALIYQELGRLDLALTHATAALNTAPEDQRPRINDFIVQLENSNASSP